MDKIYQQQQHEITEHHIYLQLAELSQDEGNTKILLEIAGYTYYISVAKNISFKKRFIEMALISLGVAVISFGIGMLIKLVFKVDV